MEIAQQRIHDTQRRVRTRSDREGVLCYCTQRSVTNLNPIAASIFFVSALSCIILANSLSYRMLAKIKSEFPESESIDYFRSDFDAGVKVARERRRRHWGIRRVGFRFLFAMAVASTLACAWELGFFRFFSIK